MPLYYPNNGTNGDFVKEAEQAQRLIINRIAAQTISAIRLVRAITNTEIIYATNDDTFDAANVLGISLNAGNIGDNIEVLLFGSLTDASLVGYSLNEPLYLGIDGSITNIAPSDGYSLEIGKSLGGTEIFLDRKQIITLA